MIASRGATTLSIMLAYFAVVVAIGVWASRRTRTASDFFAAGGGVGVFAMAMAAMAATVSGFAFIGGPGLVYSIGMGAIYILLPLSVTTCMTAWVLGTRLRVLREVRGTFTIPAAIGARYRSPAAQGLAAGAMVIAAVGYTATNFLALGIVLDAVLGTGVATGVWIGVVVTVGYSVAGGIVAGVYTDVFQGLVMATASVAVFALALRAGHGMAAISATIAAADPAAISPWGKISPLAALSFFFVFGLGAMGQPHVVHKFFLLADPRRLKWYPAIMTVAMTLTVLLFLGVGLAVKALVIRGDMPALASADDATPAFLIRFAPVGLAGLVFAGAAAAIMSSVNSFLNVGAAALTHDLPVALGRPVKNGLVWGRVATAALALAAAVVAVESGTLVAFLGIFGWGLFASTLVPALAIGLNWPGATRQGAIASILTGLGVTLVLETTSFFKVFTFPAGVTATALALVLSLGVFFVVSWVTRTHAAAQLDPDIRAIMEL